MCFFFQAEDGIRDVAVTGVQTCALPISSIVSFGTASRLAGQPQITNRANRGLATARTGPRMGYVPWLRSEERRVGKEVRARWWAEYVKKNENETRDSSSLSNNDSASLII